MKPIITSDMAIELLNKKFIKVYDLQHAEGKHYYDATRRDKNDLVAIKSDEEFRNMLPDAVSIVGIILREGDVPRLLLTQEFRYPAGQFLLSVPAGLIDEEDKDKENAILLTAARELKEETGIELGANDKLEIINPLLFSTPGMTDESNALVCAVIHLDNLGSLTQEGAVGSECFDGFDLIDKETALKYLKTGRDADGKFYSVYTWAGLMYFVSEMWK